MKYYAVFVYLSVLISQLSYAIKIDCARKGKKYESVTTFQQMQNCFHDNCIWDQDAEDGEPWCYKPEDKTNTDKEHSIANSERQHFKNDFGVKLTNATIQYSRDCLFHCTLLSRSQRISCGKSDITMRSCLRGGCCWDENEQTSSLKCYYSSAINECPPKECQNPDGKIESCLYGSFSSDQCEKAGCCFTKVGNKNLCYRKKGIVVKIASKKPISSFVDQLDMNKFNSKSLSLKDLLEKSNNELMKYTRPTLPPTTTEEPTTVRTSTQAPTTAAPYKKRVCRWFSCKWVTVEAEEKVCYPSDCGSPKFYPGSPLTLPTNNVASEITKKIVGGTRAYPFSHPWTAMVIKRENERKFLCGASIICKHWLVTAAHCTNRQTKTTNFADLDTRYYEVNVGRYMGVEHEHGKQVQKFIGHEGIDRIVIHENFTSGVSKGIITNDIALIRVKKPIIFNNFVQPICLPKVSTVEGDILWATGWGDTKYKGPSNKNMKQLGVKVHNETRCDAEVTGFKKYNPQGVICAGGEKEQDTCTGDSGGPLVGPKIEVVYENRRRTTRYRWKLFGLTSIGSPSCNTKSADTQPAIYTNVHYFKDWISKMTQNCCA